MFTKTELELLYYAVHDKINDLVKEVLSKGKYINSLNEKSSEKLSKRIEFYERAIVEIEEELQTYMCILKKLE